jgi:hypothetical protein
VRKVEEDSPVAEYSDDETCVLFPIAVLEKKR